MGSESDEPLDFDSFYSAQEAEDDQGESPKAFKCSVQDFSEKLPASEEEQELVGLTNDSYADLEKLLKVSEQLLSSSVRTDRSSSSTTGRSYYESATLNFLSGNNSNSISTGRGAAKILPWTQRGALYTQSLTSTSVQLRNIARIQKELVRLHKVGPAQYPVIRQSEWLSGSDSPGPGTYTDLKVREHSNTLAKRRFGKSDLFFVAVMDTAIVSQTWRTRKFDRRKAVFGTP